MPVMGLNHVNIRTLNPGKSAAFYADVLGLEYRQGAEVMGVRPHWLYDENGQAIIHLRVMAADGASTGPIDHVALSCKDKAAMIARLRARDVPFDLAEGIVPGATLIFVKDPHGVSLELNFAGE